MKIRMVRSKGRARGDSSPPLLEGQVYDLGRPEAEALVSSGLAVELPAPPPPAPAPQAAEPARRRAKPTGPEPAEG